MTEDVTDELVTFTEFLVNCMLVIDPAPIPMVQEAVATTALAHPEWPSEDELRTPLEWSRWKP